jgi:hypothetical protein
MSLTELQQIILMAERLKGNDERYRRLGSEYRKPVTYAEVLDLIERLARELDSVLRIATTHKHESHAGRTGMATEFEMIRGDTEHGFRSGADRGADHPGAADPGHLSAGKE